MPQIHNNSPEPAPFLVDNMALLTRGRALDVAMGTGRNAIYLAQSGFTVEGVDVSHKYVDVALKSAREVGVTISARVANLESDYRIEKGVYDLIICFHYLQRSIIPRIKDGLRTGGIVVYETFIIDQVDFGKPHNPAYLLQYNELLNMFRDFRCLRYREGIIENRKAVASIVAQKV
ncbi:MAG: hypothetical protein A2144_02760 [Chloroflexi bacterium RBG_16_50_9]|nr:MAG: hypothetical protein A2144_02760 [Chloroflexi bacterium RBG_16_50_9]